MQVEDFVFGRNVILKSAAPWTWASCGVPPCCQTDEVSRSSADSTEGLRKLKRRRFRDPLRNMQNGSATWKSGQARSEFSVQSRRSRLRRTWTTSLWSGTSWTRTSTWPPSSEKLMSLLPLRRLHKCLCLRLLLSFMCWTSPHSYAFRGGCVPTQCQDAKFSHSIQLQFAMAPLQELRLFLVCDFCKSLSLTRIPSGMQRISKNNSAADLLLEPVWGLCWSSPIDALEPLP